MTNSTANAHIHIDHTTIADNVILMISCVVALTANVFVMSLICAVRQLKTSSNIFVFSICLCNAMIALVVIPMRVFAVRQEGYGLVAYKYIVMITILIYICNLVAVSRHRLLCVTEPMTYVQTQTKQQVLKIVTVTWIAPLSYGLLPLIWFKLQHMSSTEKLVHNIYIVITLMLLLAPLIFIVYVLTRIYMQAKSIKGHEPKLSPKPRLSLSSNVEYHGPRVIYNAGNQCKFCSFESKAILLNFVCSSSENRNASTVKCKPPSEVPELLLTAPSPKQNVKQRNSIKHLPTYGSLSAPIHDQRGNLESPKLLSRDSLSSMSSNECVDVCIGRNGLSSSAIALDDDGNDDDASSSCLSSSHVGNMLQIARSASMASISSITSIASTVSLRQLLRQKSYELKSSLPFLIAAILYMITWIPVVVLTFIEVVDRKLHIPHYVEIISLYTIAFNALVDPFLYGLLLPKFRRFFRLSLRRWMDKMSVSKNHSLTS